MTLLQDGILAFFSAVGMTTVVWLLAGALLHAGRPTVPGLLLVLPLRGEALAMENDVRELRRRLKDAFLLLDGCGGEAASYAFDDFGRGAMVIDDSLQYAEDVPAAMDDAVREMKHWVTVV